MKVDSAVYFQGQKYPQELIDLRRQYLLDLLSDKQQQFYNKQKQTHVS